MRYLFLVNDASFLFEFLGKIAHQLTQEGDECFVAFNSKIAEYEKSKFFPENVKRISKIDWCIEHYNNTQKNFGDLSWRELFTVYERFNLYSYDYQKALEITNQLYQFFDYIFEKEKPDVVIGEPPAGLFGLIAYYFCQKNNIVFCGIAESRFPERIDIYDREWTYSKYEKNFKELKKEDLLPEEITFAEDFIGKFISHQIIYSSYYLVKVSFGFMEFMKHYWARLIEVRKVFWPYLLLRNTCHLVASAKQSRAESGKAKPCNRLKDFDYESEAILSRSFKAPFRTMKRNFKIPLQKSIFDKPNPKDEYFFFPIQYEPEASTLVLATYYSNQLATIKNVAITLPFPYKVYLKEHPGSVGTRPNSFYKEIKKIPNAVLLSSEESTPNIIAGSLGVITMTSTVGMEAAMQGKPVYVLGNIFYSYLPLCKKVMNFEDLEKKIREDLVKRPDTSNVKALNLRFIISYFRSSIPANIFEASQKEDNNNYAMICRRIKTWVLEEKNEYV